MMYLPHDADPNVIHVFATRGGTPVNPDWYYNVTVRDVIGDERDRIHAEPARRYPSCSEYERQTEGIRTSPCSNWRA
jgi:hypothetical protein